MLLHQHLTLYTRPKGRIIYAGTGTLSLAQIPFAKKIIIYYLCSGANHKQSDCKNTRRLDNPDKEEELYVGDECNRADQSTLISAPRPFSPRVYTPHWRYFLQSLPLSF